MSYTFRIDRTLPPIGCGSPRGPWKPGKPRAQVFRLLDCIWVLPAKTGQTSLRGALTSTLDILNKWKEKPIHLTIEEMAELQSKEGLPVIMTVRHPAARTLSAYANKFREQFEDLHDFVQAVCKVPDINADIHIQSMSALIGQVEPDHIIRTEKFSEDYVELQQNHFNWLTPAVPHANATGHGQTWKDRITPDERKALFKRYEEDYRIFNYEV